MSTRESVSTEIGDVITGSSNGGSDENTNSNQQFETEETSSRENMDAASNSVAQQNSQVNCSRFYRLSTIAVSKH